MDILKPNKLIPGDTIAVVSPASPSLTPNHMERGIEAFQRMGYRVVTSQHVHYRHLLFAGDEKARVSDIHAAFQDKSVQAIICARGGCGTAQILPHIDFSLIAKNPKIFVGYSDITALQTAIFNATGLVSFYGPMVASDFGKSHNRYKIKNFFKILTETQQTIELKNPRKRALISHTVSAGTLALR